jgi:REP element-mobilizing transposase RayT
MPTSKEELIRRGIKPHEIQHNQHRRAEWQDYGGCGLYMVTLCIEGRHPYFGYLKGNIKVRRDAVDFPHIVLTPLGSTILNEELPKIHHFYPQIELWKAAIMPDHLHLLLYVAEPLPDGKKLGDIIRRFKGGCSRAWWAQEEEKIALKSAGTAATETERTAATETAGGASAGNNTGVPVPFSTVKRPSLFEAGYHDRIIKRPGMLENIKRYMSDNPLRALMRRQLPHLLERRLHLRVGSHDYAAFGALFLVKRAEKEQVFYHRRDKKTGIPTELTEKYKRDKDRQLAEAREGVVLVSPAISKGESIVINTAIDEGLAVIQLQKEPIGNYWKPERRRFEACTRGALLILAPWGLDEEIKGMTALKGAGTTAGVKGAGNTEAAPSDYARFHHLNDLAAEICNTTDAVLLNLAGIR